MSYREGQFHIKHTLLLPNPLGPHQPLYPHTHPPPGSPPPPGRILCTVLVTIPWAGPHSLIEFNSIDNKTRIAHEKLLKFNKRYAAINISRNYSVIVWPFSSYGSWFIKPTELNVNFHLKSKNSFQWEMSSHICPLNIYHLGIKVRKLTFTSYQSSVDCSNGLISTFMTSDLKFQDMKFQDMKFQDMKASHRVQKAFRISHLKEFAELRG